eukprot:UN20263
MKVLTGLFLSLVLSTSGFAAGSNPETLIKETTSQVLSEIKANSAKYQEDTASLYKLVDDVVLPHFDFASMTDLALGRYKTKSMHR